MRHLNARRTVFLGIGLLVLSTASAEGQEMAFGGRCRQPAPVAPCPIPGEARPAVPPAAEPASLATEPTISPEQFAATGGGESFAAASGAVGYIDPALPVSQIRLRADAAYDSNRPDRAEFFYAKCGCFKLAGLDPNANGPPLGETRLDYQELNTYIEWAPSQRVSGFVELPVRFVNPEVNANAAGFADMNAGFKYAFVYEEQRIVTFQLKGYAPTGDPFRGLGNDHYSLEPALLAYQQLSDRLGFEGELRDWVPIGGTDFQGNIFRYGAGLNYRVYDSGMVRVSPVVELVGWTLLNGREFAFPEGVVFESGGKTILNAKVGVRTGLGRMSGNELLSRADVYAGYGRALTGDFWYKDIMRLEFRLRY